MSNSCYVATLRSVFGYLQVGPPFFSVNILSTAWFICLVRDIPSPVSSLFGNVTPWKYLWRAAMVASYMYMWTAPLLCLCLMTHVDKLKLEMHRPKFYSCKIIPFLILSFKYSDKGRYKVHIMGTIISRITVLASAVSSLPDLCVYSNTQFTVAHSLIVCLYLCNYGSCSCC